MADKELPNGDYILTEGGAWFTLGGFSIRILKTDDGVLADIYQLHREMEDCLASCYAFDNELKPLPAEGENAGS